ncbi:MAG: PEP-CTERM system TPR-repeat protein PrsT [Acetobacteraceae bacterium]|nr:PEP-CTERM system TPR-repeat protein PrsT [Acetobacteraceae bacterium]
MRHRLLGWGLVGVGAALLPSLAHARDYLADAREAMQKGDLKSAQIELRNAVRDDPQNAEAHYQLGRVNLFLGDPVAAEKEEKAARERGYDPRKIVAVLGQAYISQGKYHDLLNDFVVEHKDPSLDAQVLVARGIAKTALRDSDGAAQSFAEAEQLAPDALEPLTAEFRLAMAKGDLSTAKAKLDRALALQPKNQDVLLEKVQFLHRTGDLSGALAAADELVKTAPSFPQGKLERANVLIAADKDAAAVGDVNAVLQVLPGHPRALMLEALLQARRREFGAADATLQKIGQAMTSLPRAYLLEAYVKAELGDWEQADDFAQRYVARAPDDLSGIKLLGGVEMQRQRPDKVIALLAKPAAAGIADAGSFDLLGRAYAAMGRQADATAAYEKAAALAPDDPQMRGRLAASRLAMGDADAAVSDLEKALEIAPKQTSIGAELFFAQLETGDFNRAADAIARIRKAQGDTPVVQNLDGVLKLSELDLSGAKAEFERIVAASPGFVPARLNLSRIAAMEGRNDDAQVLLRGILEKDPASEPALGMLVGILAGQGKTADAAALLQRASRVAPDVRFTVGLADFYSRTGEPTKAIALLEQDQPKLKASELLLGALARAQMVAGQKADARSSYSQIVMLDPRALEARLQLIALLVEGGDFEAARNVVRDGLRAMPENIQLLKAYIAIDNKAGGFERALATADQLRGQISDTPDAQALRGDVYMTAKRYDEAANAFAAELARRPSAFLLERLAGAQLAGGHIDIAAKTLADWLANHPTDSPIAQALAGIELQQHQYPQAATHLRIVLQQKPNDASALNNLAWIDAQRGDPKARELAQRAYLLLPAGQIADTLGWILVKQGAADKGLYLLRQASAQLPGNLDVQYHLAAALSATGKPEEAKRLLSAIMGARGNFAERQDAQKLLDQLSKT